MLTGKLHPYQDPVVDAALDRGRYLIAADMGTGKTVMSIAVAEELLGCGDISRVLIVVPSSLKYQWAQSLSKFTDLPSKEIKVGKKKITVPADPKCVIIDGRTFQKNKVKYSAADDRKRQYDSVTDETEYVVLSYESILDDSRQVRKLHPGLVILDECTQIKSFRAQRSKKIKRMLDAEYRIGLTGTPIENGRPEELFSIMQWVDEDVLGRWDFFDKTYIRRDSNGISKGYKNLPVLRERLAPAMSRLSRTDKGVKSYMPDVEEDEWEVPLEGPIRDAYFAMARHLYAELKNLGYAGRKFSVSDYYGGQADENTKVGRVMAVHMAMEMLLDHPDLVVASGMSYEKTKDLPYEQRKGSKYAYQVWQEGLLDDVWDSPKLEHLKLQLNERLAAGTNKILVYTKYRTMIPILVEYLGMPTVQYHGEMTSSQKAAAVVKFADPAGPQVFLSSHAGAYGCDMNMADHLVNYDNAWQAGKADQINARHVRASSEFSMVRVSRMLFADTIERRILDSQVHKRRVSGAVMDGHGADKYGRVDNDVISLTKFLEETVPDVDLVLP